MPTASLRVEDVAVPLEGRESVFEVRVVDGVCFEDGHEEENWTGTIVVAVSPCAPEASSCPSPRWHPCVFISPPHPSPAGVAPSVDHGEEEFCRPLCNHQATRGGCGAKEDKSSHAPAGSRVIVCSHRTEGVAQSGDGWPWQSWPHDDHFSPVSKEAPEQP